MAEDKKNDAAVAVSTGGDGDEGCETCPGVKRVVDGSEGFVCPSARLSDSLVDGEDGFEQLFVNSEDAEKNKVLAGEALGRIRRSRKIGAVNIGRGKIGDTEYWLGKAAGYYDSNRIEEVIECFDAFKEVGLRLMRLGWVWGRDDDTFVRVRLLVEGEIFFSRMDSWLEQYMAWLKKIKCVKGLDWEMIVLRGRIAFGFNCWGNMLEALAEVLKNEGDAGGAEALYGAAVDKYEFMMRLERACFEDAFYSRGVALYRLFLINKDTVCEKKGAECIARAGRDVLGILSEVSGECAKALAGGTALYCLLDGEATEESRFFEKATRYVDKKEIDDYKKIYVRSLHIVSLLRLLDPYENETANYMTKAMAEDMLIGKGGFKLRPIGKANDPNEGKLLLDFLFKNKKWEFEEQDEFKTYAGYFTFGYDWLPQFILYGNRNKCDKGTGLSLVFDREFFRGYGAQVTQKNGVVRDDGKRSIYRCVYFDEKNGKVDSVGQLEESLFLRKRKNGYDLYKKKIDRVKNTVDVEVKELKRLVESYEQGTVNWNIASVLMMHLRYLFKNAQYKSEQECRVVKICNVAEERDIMTKGRDGVLKIPYAPNVPEHVTRIYFGPQVEDIEQFQVSLKYDGLRVESEKSSCDFRG
jgi:hypothetical protein